MLVVLEAGTQTDGFSPRIWTHIADRYEPNPIVGRAMTRAGMARQSLRRAHQTHVGQLTHRSASMTMPTRKLTHRFPRSEVDVVAVPTTDQIPGRERRHC